ncbi:hypothetical protein ABIE67_000617 [Streptomyces sp. V4I8]
MASVVEERELAARERVEGLREEADRVLTALIEAEMDWQEWVIARQYVGEVLSVPRVPEPGVACLVPTEGLSASEPAPGPVVDASAAAPMPRTGPIVPVWRPALSADVLAVDYQRILGLLAERRSAGDGVMTCQEITAGLGLAPVPACVEGVRSKMKRLADRGWTKQRAAGRFMGASASRGTPPSGAGDGLPAQRTKCNGQWQFAGASVVSATSDFIHGSKSNEQAWRDRSDRRSNSDELKCQSAFLKFDAGAMAAALNNCPNPSMSVVAVPVARKAAQRRVWFAVRTGRRKVCSRRSTAPTARRPLPPTTTASASWGVWPLTQSCRSPGRIRCCPLGSAHGALNTTAKPVSS